MLANSQVTVAVRPPGPTSVREQIKMINEKFAGAAGTQWQNREPYPSQPAQAGLDLRDAVVINTTPPF